MSVPRTGPAHSTPPCYAPPPKKGGALIRAEASLLFFGKEKKEKKNKLERQIARPRDSKKQTKKKRRRYTPKAQAALDSFVSGFSARVFGSDRDGDVRFARLLFLFVGSGREGAFVW